MIISLINETKTKHKISTLFGLYIPERLTCNRFKEESYNQDEYLLSYCWIVSQIGPRIWSEEPKKLEHMYWYEPVTGSKRMGRIRDQERWVQKLRELLHRQFQGALHH